MNFRQALENSVRSIACGNALGAEALWGLVGNAVDSSVLGSPPVNLPRAIANGAGALAGLLCNREPTEPPPTPFNGGQCDGAPYEITFNQSFDQAGFSGGQCTENAQTGTIVLNRIGPISVDVQSDPRGPISPECPNRENIDVVVNGTPEFGPNGIVAGSYNLDISISRTDGQPDDCGSPSPEAPPLPANIPQGIPDNVTFTPDSGPDITVPVVLFFGFAYVNASADINIPVRINLDNNVDIFADLNLSTGDINFNFGNRQPDTQPPCNYPPDDSIPDPPPEEENTLSRIIAVRVTTSVISNFSPITEIFQSGGNPTVVIPDLGLVSFLVETSQGGGGQSWTTDLRVKSTDTTIFCPSPYGAIRVRGSPRAGVAFTLRSIRAEISSSLFPT